MQIGPKIRWDSHTLGNAVKNFSPVAGLLGGPAGIALAGGLSAAGDKLRGKDVSVKNALTNAALATGVHGLKSALTHGAPAAPNAAAATDVVSHGGLSLPTTPNLTTVAEHAVDPRTFGEKALDFGKGIGSFAKENPTATALGLQAAGNLSTSGAQNRTANAQADLLEKQAEESEYDFLQRKQRDAQLKPLWSSIGSSIGSGYASLPPNPYLPTGG